MTQRTSKEVVNQAIADFNSIKEAILGHKIDVPYPTKTCEYAGLIAKLRVGCIAGRAYPVPNASVCSIVSDNATVYHNGRTVLAIVGTAEAIIEEE